MATSEAIRRDHRAMLRFLALNALIGMAAGFAVFAGLMWFDTGGIATRIAHSANPLLPAMLIALPLALTFGGAAAASAIMLLPYEKKFTCNAES